MAQAEIKMGKEFAGRERSAAMAVLNMAERIFVVPHLGDSRLDEKQRRWNALITVSRVLPKLDVDEGIIPDPDEERAAFFAEYGLTKDHCPVEFCRGIRAALLETR